MKKVIFLAIAAAAALTACSKSEVIDSKYGNDMIGFETYLGRDAQTKGSVETAKTIQKVGVFGYYLGVTNTYGETTEANLYNPLTLIVNDKGEAQAPTGNDIRYWTNASDYYTFLAYAPMEEVTVTTTDNKGADPTINYTVNSTLSEQVDVLSAEPQIGRQKDDGTVALVLKHRLSRLTVKARATAGNFDYHIKSITLNGQFYPSGNLKLATPDVWFNTTAATTEYVFPTVETDALPKPATKNETVDYKDYAGTNNYLMMIPVKKETHSAKLTVVYTTSYMVGEQKMESDPYEKEFDVKHDFIMGTAYAIALEFVQDTDNEIKFSVEVVDWGKEEEQNISPAN